MDAAFSDSLAHADIRLLVLAIALAVAASYVSFRIFGHAIRCRTERKIGWLFLAAICSAFGLWAAHFVTMLGQGPDIPRESASVLTLVALLGIAGIGCAGFAVASRGAPADAVLGGAIIGAGMGVMHYVSMYALCPPGALKWDLPLVLVSIALGMGFSSAALAVYQWFKGQWAIWGAAVLQATAFFSLHFTGVHAARVVSQSLALVAPTDPHHWLLAAIAVGTALIILGIGFVSTVIDRQTIHDNVETMQQLVDAAIEGIVVAKDGLIVSVNRRAAELCGAAPHELIGKSVAGHLLDHPPEEGNWAEASLLTTCGARVPVKVAHRRLGAGDEVYAIHDLTERRAAEARLQRQNEALKQREEELRARNLQFDTALKHMSQGLCMYDKDERVVVNNDRFATIYGLAPDDVRPGMTRREIIELRIARGAWAGASAADYLHERTQPINASGHLVQEMCDGRSILLAHVPMPGGGWVCTHEDVTERRQAQDTIEHLARHDGLTDLPNRVLLRERLQEALARMRPGEGLAVHSLDLDRFKEVNDALGHAIGDELLVAVASRLRELGSNVDTLARIGADEFVIVQYPADSPTAATDLAAQVLAAMTEPFSLGDRFQVVLGTSIGIAMAPGDGTDADQLLKDASLALYRAKEEERGSYRFFEQDMDARMRARHELECNLRNALANGELDLDYQPLLNLKRDEISGFEALLRWRPPGASPIPPSEFVPLAEETGLIVPIGEWALRQALAEAAKWPKHIRVAVNLSPVQFSSRNLAQIVMSALGASGVDPGRLELEITESLLLQARDTTLATLHQLRDLGVRIALDDFGTGYSSLNYLRSFPFDKIKIDRCFIAGLAEGNEESMAIVRAVAQLGASLGIATTAEGVETQLQADIARKEGCTEIQGYWLGRPKRAAEIAEEFDLYRRTRKPRRAGAVASETAFEDPESVRDTIAKAATPPKRGRRDRRAGSA